MKSIEFCCANCTSKLLQHHSFFCHLLRTIHREKCSFTGSYRFPILIPHYSRPRSTLRTTNEWSCISLINSEVIRDRLEPACRYICCVKEMHVLIVKRNIKLAKLLELCDDVWKRTSIQCSLVARLWLSFVFTTLHNLRVTLWGKSTMYRFFGHPLGIGVNWQHFVKGASCYFKSSNCFG